MNRDLGGRDSSPTTRGTPKRASAAVVAKSWGAHLGLVRIAAQVVFDPLGLLLFLV